MITNVYYNLATEAIIDFFAVEFKTFGSNDVNKLINYFHKLSSYKEEELQVRPSIVLTSNINSVVKNVPDCVKIPFYNDENFNNFEEHLKSLLCFCANNWLLYINFNSEGVEYGLIKCVNSIKEKSFKTLIFEDNTREILESKTKLVLIDVKSDELTCLRGIKGTETNISFSLTNASHSDVEDAIKNFVEDVLSKLKTTPRKLQDIKTLYTNTLINSFQKLHGTLCLVVDKDFKDTKGLLSDGTWLPEPIDFGKLFMQSKSYNESKLRAYADLLVTMLNYDGITIIDNRGRIRAYNVFIENSKKASEKIVGGARLRAAYTLLNTTNSKICGLYFQSHEGTVFYKTTKQARKELSQKDVIDLGNYSQLEMGINDSK